jgi:hypothetical protein
MTVAEGWLWGAFAGTAAAREGRSHLPIDCHTGPSMQKENGPGLFS